MGNSENHKDTTNKMRLSVSQIKKFIKSKAEWAGQYILMIKEESFIPAFVVGKGVHKAIEFYNSGQGREKGYNAGIEIIVQSIGDNLVSDEVKEKMFCEYEICLENYKLIQEQYGFDKHESAEAFVKTKVCDIEFIGYVDAIDGNTVVDYKTVGRVTTEKTTAFGGYGLKPLEEYELQAWIYMLATGKKEAMFIEILKKKFKTKIEPGAIHEYLWSDDWNKQMEEKFYPIIKEMKAMNKKASDLGILLEKR